MTAQVWRFGGHTNIVANAFGNFLVAAWADITLERFVGLHTADVDVAVEAIPN